MPFELRVAEALIVDSDMYIFLLRRDYGILLLPLQSRQFPSGSFDDAQSNLDLFFSNHQRRSQSDDVLMCRFSLNRVSLRTLH